MAVSPTTIKLIAKIAINILKDEEKRKKLIIGIVVGIIIILFIILIPLFILLSPLEALKLYFKSNDDGTISDSSYTSMVDIKNNYVSENLSSGELVYSGGKMPLPLENPTVTCEFGSRIHPVTKKPSFHTGIDLASAWHSDVMSVEDGIVVFAGVQGGYGNCVEIEHLNTDETKYYTFYAHLARIDVIKGQEIVQGNVIGIQGGDPKKDPNPRI